MLRVGAIFVVLCMVLIAASAGAVLYLLVGLRGQESMIIAISILTGLAIYNATSNRQRDRADLGAQIADLSRGTADLARQVAEVGRRAATLEEQGDKIVVGHGHVLSLGAPDVERDRADAIDPTFDAIAGLQRPDAFRRAREDQIAGLQVVEP